MSLSLCTSDIFCVASTLPLVLPTEFHISLLILDTFSHLHLQKKKRHQIIVPTVHQWCFTASSLHPSPLSFFCHVLTFQEKEEMEVLFRCLPYFGPRIFFFNYNFTSIFGSEGTVDGRRARGMVKEKVKGEAWRPEWRERRRWRRTLITQGMAQVFSDRNKNSQWYLLEWLASFRRSFASWVER